MVNIKFAESVPYRPTVRKSNWYTDRSQPWKYIYRYKGNIKNCISNMVTKAEEMISNGYRYNYVNPSFGEYDWCCVTIVSYWVYCGLGKKWVFGSSAQPYIWSPSYGGDYDKLLLDNDFAKYDYSDNWLSNKWYRAGDILMSNGHTVMIIEDEQKDKIFEVSNMPTLINGDRGNIVKNLQALLNLWTTQTGKNQPIKVDGIFGNETEERLKLYQKKQGLTVDGICGYESWKDILTG